MRAAAAEGLGRLRNPTDRAALSTAFNDEHSMSPRLSAAFALVLLGESEYRTAYGPLRYLVNSAQSTSLARRRRRVSD